MSELTVTLIVLACICGATALGMAIRPRLSPEHLDSESKDVVRLVMAIVGTIAALVLSLILYSTNASYNDRRDALENMAAHLVLLDALLVEYGPEADEARDLLRETVANIKDRIWPSAESQEATPGPATTLTVGRTLFGQLLALAPTGEAQTIVKSQALQVAVSLATARQVLVAQQESRAVPTFFIAVIVAWLSILYASFGLFAPPNRVVIGSLFLSALSVSGAIFLILEMSQPFGGVIGLSPAPIENVYANLGR